LRYFNGFLIITLEKLIFSRRINLNKIIAEIFYKKKINKIKKNKINNKKIL